MANNISNRISMDGGDDVRKQLQAIGDAGEQLFTGLKALADQFGRIDFAQGDAIRSKLQQTSEAASGLGDRVGGEFAKIGSSAATTTANLQTSGTSLLGYATQIGVAVGALALAAGAILSSIAKSAGDTTATLDSAASKFGLTTAAYQRLAQVADNAGLSVDSFNKILGDVDRASTLAASGFSRIIPPGTINAFQNLGGELAKLSDQALPTLAGGLAVARESATGTIDLIQKFGDTTVTVINGVSKSAFDLAKASDNIKGPAHAAAGALAELGLSAEILAKATLEQKLQLIATQLDKLPDGAAKASLAAKLLGADWRNAMEFFKAGDLAGAAEGLRAFTDDEIKTGKALKDALDELGKAFQFTKDKIGLLFAPGQTARAEWLTNLIDDARKLVFGFIAADDAKQKLLASGSFDFFRDFDLQKFQDFLNQKGETGLAAAMGFIRDLALDLARVWTSVLIPAGQLLIAGFDAIAQGINSIFGSDISGRFLAIVTVLGLVTGAFGLLGTVLSPIGTLIGFLLSSFATLAPLLLGAGLAVRAFWTEFRVGGTAAIAAVRTEQAGFLAGFAALARGSFAEAWTLFKTSALSAFATVKDSLSQLFGAGGSTFTAIRSLISGVALAAAGLAAIFNAIFGTNIGVGGLLLVAVLTQMTIGFRTLAIAGQLLAALFTPIGAGIAAVIASGIILARVFPDIGKSWNLVTEAFGNLLRGEFSKAFDALGEAFSGTWANLKNQGVLTWTILGAGAIAVTSAVAGLIEKVTGLTKLLALISAPLAALVSAGLIADDFARAISGALGPIEQFEKKVTALNKDFADGKISADEYNARMKALHGTFSETSSDNASTTQGFADSWKAALAKISEAMRGTAATSTETAGQVAGPWKAAAQRVAGDFTETSKGIWENVGAGSKSAADGVVKDFSSAAGAVQTGFKQIAPGIWEKIPEGAKAAGQLTEQTWKDVGDTVAASLANAQKAFNALGDAGLGAGPGDQFTAAATKAGELAAAADQAKTALTGVDGATTTANTSLSQLAQSEGTVTSGLSTMTSGASDFSQRFADAVNAITAGSNGIAASLDTVIAKLQEAAAASQALQQAAPTSGAGDPSGGGGNADAGFASGGFTGNIGHQRIAGVVHGNEHVQPAWVVARPGVLAFLEMLRHSGDLATTIARFVGGFSLGGFVDGLSRSFSPMALPGYDRGGLVKFAPAMAGGGNGGLHPVTIDFGGHRVGGLFAAPDIVRALKQQSVLDRIASGGRTPSRGRS